MNDDVRKALIRDVVAEHLRDRPDLLTVHEEAEAQELSLSDDQLDEVRQAASDDLDNLLEHYLDNH